MSGFAHPPADPIDADGHSARLIWPGKARAWATAETPAATVVAPPPGDGLAFEAAGNLIIEGDNLEALKHLRATHHGRIKLIYIDPPYNTGADALYPDVFAKPGPARRRGGDTAGRGHAPWLNMMAPRLRLARDLLSEDGVIFVSIDSAELANLILLCDEVFGEANRIEIFSWVRTTTPAALAGKTKKVVEYLVCYERRRSKHRYQGVEKPVRSSNPLLNQANPVGELVFPAGVITTGLADGVISAGIHGTSAYRVELLESARVAGGRFATPVRLRGRFRWNQAYLEAQLAAGVSIRIATRKLVPAYAKASYGREALPNLIDARVGVGTNESATAELRGLLGADLAELARGMRPKPVSLIKYLIEAVCAGSDDLVLDFFAGSGATGQAVLELNAERDRARRFILVQSAEPTWRADCPTIADILRRRIRAAIARLPAEAHSGEDRDFRLLTLIEAPGGGPL